MPVCIAVNAYHARPIVWATLLLTVVLFLPCEKVSGQEKRTTIRRKETLSAPLSPQAVAQRSIAEINRIRNVMVVSEVKAGIPYMRNTFREPWIQQMIMSVNAADTVQGGSFQLYLLKDTFRLRMAYDGKYLRKTYEEESDSLFTVNLQQHPYEAHSVLGPTHLYIRNVMTQALERKATLTTTEENDSLKLEVLFPDYYIEIEAARVTMARDTVGFISRYVIYLDKNTFLPLKIVRDMPHQTSVETFLFQRINFTDTLTIDALNTPTGSVTTNLPASGGQTPAKKRVGIKTLIGKPLDAWRLAQIDGDTLSFKELKGKKGVIVFNSIGWKPCMQVLPLLTRLAATPATFVVSIEPFITNVEALKKHRETQAIGYPIVITNRTLKQTYPGVQVPTFLITDAGGIVRDVIEGYTGAATEARIQQVLQQIH